MQIALHAVSKSYSPGSYAVDQATIMVEQGALIALLGPSGCGKTTTLRLIAGLEQPDSGEIWLAGQQVAGGGVWVPPESRRVGMVFQDYALFPHLTVAENIAFALHRQPKTEQRQRVAELVELVGLEGFDRRYPHEISGGQQQRVAVARSLAANPAVVLLDEPFSNLDAALRTQMREQVRRIIRAAEITTILVTHDQEEALSLADQIVVMFDGQIAQIGSPQAIYRRPASRQVAEFVGDTIWLAGQGQGETAASILGEILLTSHAYGPVDLLIRPEQIQLHVDPDGMGKITQVHYFGHTQLIEVALSDGSHMQARCGPDLDLAPGASVRLKVVGSVVAYPI